MRRQSILPRRLRACPIQDPAISTTAESGRARACRVAQTYAPLLLLAAACESSADPIEETVVPITVQVADYEGPVSLLVSAVDGRVFEVVDVDAPTTVELTAPEGGSVSTAFAGDVTADAYVLSFADLASGDAVIMRPIPWSVGGSPFLVTSPPAPDGFTIAVDAGCNGQPTRGSPPVRARCRQDPLLVGARLVRDDDGSTADATTLAVPDVDPINVLLPPLDQWGAALTTVQVTLEGPLRSVSLELRGRVGTQAFEDTRPFDVRRASSSDRTRTIEMLPFDYDAFDVTVVGSDLWMVQTVDGAPSAFAVDASTQLPVVTASAVPGSIAWRTSGPVDAVDLVVLLYGARSWIRFPDPGVRFWFVIKRPAESGDWVVPDLPDALSAWNADSAPTVGSSVVMFEHEADRATAQQDPITWLPPHRPEPGAGARFGRTAVAMP